MRRTIMMAIALTGPAFARGFDGGGGGSAGGEGEGVSRWRQRQAAKSMMYAMSNEGTGEAIARRRMQSSATRYEPQVQGWQGQAWGLASAKVQGRKPASSTRFSGRGGGELVYGERRGFMTDLPPEDPVSFLSREKKKKEPEATAAAARGDLQSAKRARRDEGDAASKKAKREEAAKGKKGKEAKKKKKKRRSRSGRTRTTSRTCPDG